MARKVLRLLLPISIGALIAGLWPEIVRYFKIEMMSVGSGHPGLVPAHGRRGYPEGPGGDADGHGEFDSASRGGPEHNEISATA
jgi:hypothetical protein